MLYIEQGESIEQTRKKFEEKRRKAKHKASC